MPYELQTVTFIDKITTINTGTAIIRDDPRDTLAF